MRMQFASLLLRQLNRRLSNRALIPQLVAWASGIENHISPDQLASLDRLTAMGKGGYMLTSPTNRRNYGD